MIAHVNARWSLSSRSRTNRDAATPTLEWTNDAPFLALAVHAFGISHRSPCPIRKRAILSVARHHHRCHGIRRRCCRSRRATCGQPPVRAYGVDTTLSLSGPQREMRDLRIRPAVRSPPMFAFSCEADSLAVSCTPTMSNYLMSTFSAEHSKRHSVSCSCSGPVGHPLPSSRCLTIRAFPFDSCRSRNERQTKPRCLQELPFVDWRPWGWWSGAAAPEDRLSAEDTIRDIRRATRKQHAAEEKIRIVLEGLRGEKSIAELCRQEGIAQSLYYGWSKEFLEAGKQRLAARNPPILKASNLSHGR